MEIYQIVSFISLFLSVVIYILALKKEFTAKKLIIRLEKEASQKGLIKLSKKAEENAKKNYLKFSKQMSTQSSLLVKEYLESSFNKSKEDLDKKQEELFKNLEEDIKKIKQEKIAQINDAVSKTVKKISQEILKTEINKQVDQDLILKELDEFLGSKNGN